MSIGKKQLLLFSVLLITFLIYTSLHSIRTVWAYSKSAIKNDPYMNGIDSHDMGSIDLSFLLSYSLSFFAFGWLGDYINLKVYLSIALMGSSLSFLAIMIMRSYMYYNLYLLVLFQGMNGMFQALGWPGVLACLAHWTKRGKTGLLMGIWSGCPNFGNIVGFQIGAIVIDYNKDGWEQNTYCIEKAVRDYQGREMAILYSCIFVFIMEVVMLLFLFPKPENAGLEKSGDSLNQSGESLENAKNTVQEQNKIGFFKAWTIPGVPFYALSFACLKGTQYGMLFWLASYLKNIGLNEMAAPIVQMNDLGQFLGGIFLGWLCDRFKKKAIFMAPSILLTSMVFILLRYVASAQYVFSYFLLIFLCGVFLGGPYNIICSALSADLGKHPSLKGNDKAVASVSGVVEGAGSLGAALIQKLIPLMESSIFQLFTILSISSALIILPLAYKDYIAMRKRETPFIGYDKPDSKKFLEIVNPLLNEKKDHH